MKKLLLLMCALFLFGIGFAQSLQTHSLVTDRVEELVGQGRDFTPVRVMDQQALPAGKRADFQDVPGATFLTLDKQSVQNVIAEAPELMEFEVPGENGATEIMQLYKVEVFAPGFGVKTSESNGAYVEVEEGVHYRGTLKGQPGSLAAVSLFGEEVMGFVALEDGNLTLGKVADPQMPGTHIFYKETKVQHEGGLGCGTHDKAGSYSHEELQPHGGANKAGDCIRVYFEADRDIYQNKGSVSNATNYITGMFNQGAIIYDNENINMAISEIFVWTSNSPYRGNSASSLLGKFQTNRPSYNGDIAQLLNFKNLGGIAASIGGMCTGDQRDAMSYSGVESSYNNVPTYSFTIALWTHEVGHIFNSRHTHACVWNGNNTAIDGCSTTEGSCPSPGLPSAGGTVMSYCDFTSVGLDLSLGFGPQPGNVIRNYIASLNCTSSNCGGTGGNTCSNGVQDGDETGVDCGGSCDPCQGGGTCDVPSGTVATNIRNNRAKLNWSAVASANDYTVQVREVGTSSWTQVSAGGTNVTVRNLSRGATYEWEVRANCTGSSSAYSASCTFTAGSSNSSACGSGSKLGAELAVYPNPVSGLLNVAVPFSESTSLRLEMRDVMGRVLMVEAATAGESRTIQMDQLSAGIYYLALVDGNGVLEIRKVVKK